MYTLGLLIYELVFSERYWQRGDRVNILQIRENLAGSNANKETAGFLIEKAEEFLRPKPEERLKLGEFIVNLLDFYAKNFKNA